MVSFVIKRKKNACLFFFKEHEHGMSDHIESQYTEFCDDFCVAVHMTSWWPEDI